MSSLYNKTAIDKLIKLIESQNGIKDKSQLESYIQQEMGLVLDRSVYYCNDFAIRFNQGQSARISNTVTSLSRLQKYDSIPFFACVVTPTCNHIQIANTTFLKKISHSSQKLRIDNIKGSFNGSDIMAEFDSIPNIPANFELLFAYHQGYTFEDNLERLVESTNKIKARTNKFDVTEELQAKINDSITRAKEFIASDEYEDLNRDLNSRVQAVQSEIAIAAFIDNVNIRGRIIEYLVTSDTSSLKEQIMSSLQEHKPLPVFQTEDKLGDYEKEYTKYLTQTDIKTKIMFLGSNPKAFNVDKLLEFLSQDKSVYMIYLIGINEDKSLVTGLYSFLDTKLLNATKFVHHWSGRSSRGTAQYIGSALSEILKRNCSCTIDIQQAKQFMLELIKR